MRIKAKDTEFLDYLENLDNYRTRAITLGTIMPEDSKEYLHQLFRFSSFFEKILVKDKKLQEGAKQILKQINDSRKTGSAELEFDPLQNSYWQVHNPKFFLDVELFSVQVLKENYSSMNQGFHLVQSLKYLDLHGADEKKHNEVFPTLKPCLGAGRVLEMEAGERDDPLKLLGPHNIDEMMLEPHKISELEYFTSNKITVSKEINKPAASKINKMILDAEWHGFSKLRLVASIHSLTDLYYYEKYLEKTTEHSSYYGIPLNRLKKEEKVYEVFIDLLNEFGPSNVEYMLHNQIFKKSYLDQNQSLDNLELRTTAASMLETNPEMISKIHNPRNNKNTSEVYATELNEYTHITGLQFANNETNIYSMLLRSPLNVVDEIVLPSRGSLEKRVTRLGSLHNPLYVKGTTYNNKTVTNQELKLAPF